MKTKHCGIGHISRLKDKFLQDKTTKPEIIELLLSYVIKGKDVKSLAKNIYKKGSGNFRKVFDVVEKEEFKGAGSETKIFFSLLKEYINACNEEKFINRKYKVKEQEDVITYYRSICAGRDREAVYAVFLDAKNKVIDNKKVGEGTLTQSLLYPREIIKEALSKGALSMVIIHNHPSGDAKPSDNDRKITKKLMFATKEMDIVLLDHIIVGSEGKGYYSFYEEGLIDRYGNEYKTIVESLANS